MPKIQMKRGIKANLPALAPGEFGLATDARELYIGGSGENLRIPILGGDGKVPTDQLPAMNYDPAGSAAGVQRNLDAHTGDTTIHVTAQEKATWSGKANIAMGSYIGTGVLPVSVTFSFQPLFIILGPVGWDPLSQNLGSTSYAWPCIIPYGVPSARFGNDIANFSWEGTTFKITKLDRLNNINETYHYFAFG